MMTEAQILLFLFKTFCDTDYLLIFFINKRHNQMLSQNIFNSLKHREPYIYAPLCLPEKE